MPFKPVLLAASASLVCAAAAPGKFTAPTQPWTGPNDRVNLSRPAAARQSTSDEAISTLMSPGWRLV